MIRGGAFFQNAVNQAVLDVYPAGEGVLQIADQLFIRWGILIRVFGKECQQ